MYAQAEAASKSGSARWDLKRANSAYKAFIGSADRSTADQDANDAFFYQGWAVAPRSGRRQSGAEGNDRGNQLALIFSVIAALSLLVKFALVS